MTTMRGYVWIIALFASLGAGRALAEGEASDAGTEPAAAVAPAAEPAAAVDPAAGQAPAAAPAAEPAAEPAAVPAKPVSKLRQEAGGEARRSEAAWRAKDGRSEEELAAETKECVSCHNPEDEMELDLDSEEVVNLKVDPKTTTLMSVHAKLACTECHPDFKGKTTGHKGKGHKNLREYSLYWSEGCKECHFQNYTKTLDGVHHAVAANKGKLEAAVCVDCHGSHEIKPAGEPRAGISKTCSRCHEKISAAYAKSVHGKALTDGEGPDAPTCTDCHRSHDIEDPRGNAWRLGTPEMCGGCHTNEKMMRRYGLSTKVLSTYLSDFHGSTTLLQKGEDGAGKPQAALCTDCHGVHDITKADDPNSPVLAANLQKTCQKCHKDAAADFPKAWLSHYEPTWEKAPLVTAVGWFYAFLIPFMIGGLVLQILLHLWRVVVNR